MLWRWRRPTRVRRPNLGESVAKPPPTLPGRAKTGRWRKRKSLPDGPAPGNRQIHMFLFVYWSVHSFIREACSSSTPHCGRRSCLCSHPQIDSGPRKVHQFDHCALLVDGINRSSGFQRLNPTAFFSEPTCTVVSGLHSHGRVLLARSMANLLARHPTLQNSPFGCVAVGCNWEKVCKGDGSTTALFIGCL